MAEQIPGNFASTRVAVGGYTAGSLVLNVLSTATPFPAVGTYSLVVYNNTVNPAVPRGILRASAVNSATQFAVAAEGTDFNAVAGDYVYAVISHDAEVALQAAAVAAGAAAGAAIALAGSYTNVEDEGTPLAQRNTLNFAGAGVTATDAGGKTLVTIPGSSGSGYDTVEDEGTPLTQRSTMNFVGAGVSAADTGGVTVVTIAGGGSGGALVLLEQHTASASASLNFTTCITSTYDDYVIELVNVLPATDAADLMLRMSTDGGSSYDSGANYSYIRVRVSVAATATAGGTGQTSLLLYTGTKNTSTWGIAGSIHLFSPLSTALFKQILWKATSIDSTSRAFRDGSGAYEITTAVNAFQFLFSSGNIASGTIRVYGIAKT